MKYVFVLLLITQFAHAAVDKRLKPDFNYKTFFGNCPAKAVGSLVLNLVRQYEVNPSLKALKEKIVQDKLEERHFLSEYKITYNPIDKELKFIFDCSKPLMKVQIYKDNTGEEFYTAILTENGKLVDPTYEILLRSEGKLKGSLPSLVYPVSKLEGHEQYDIIRAVQALSDDLKENISEVILSDKLELTMILSLSKKPVSIFLGQHSWENKVDKINKIISHMQTNKKMPTIINITNSKKVVVKFSESI
jgi:hypothetical protein